MAPEEEIRLMSQLKHSLLCKEVYLQRTSTSLFFEVRARDRTLPGPKFLSIIFFSVLHEYFKFSDQWIISYQPFLDCQYHWLLTTMTVELDNKELLQKANHIFQIQEYGWKVCDTATSLKLSRSENGQSLDGRPHGNPKSSPPTMELSMAKHWL